MPPYSASGEQYDARDVLDDDELAVHLHRRRETARYRNAKAARTGVMPRAIPELTEEAALNAYERHIHGEAS